MVRLLYLVVRLLYLGGKAAVPGSKAAVPGGKAAAVPGGKAVHSGPADDGAPVDGDGAKNKLLQFQFELKIPSLKSGA